MTVKELKDSLAFFQEDALIVVAGYEEGLELAMAVTEIRIKPFPPERVASYYGEYEYCPEGTQKAVYIRDPNGHTHCKIDWSY